jgi:hypothetical protein
MASVRRSRLCLGVEPGLVYHDGHLIRQQLDRFNILRGKSVGFLTLQIQDADNLIANTQRSGQFSASAR